MTKRRRRIAWIAIAAMLFGAVSPALAATLFAGHPEILGRMLAIPAAEAYAVPQAVADDDDGCPHETVSHAAAQPSSHDHGSGGGGSHEKTEHAAHGIFCSFCLSASSVAALLFAGPTSFALAAASELIGKSEILHAEVTPSLHRARGPPALSS